MHTQDMILLLFFISVFVSFGITLAFASWDETRTRAARAARKEVPAPRASAPRAAAPSLDLTQGVRAR